jgi:hypothetical protein
VRFFACCTAFIPWRFEFAEWSRGQDIARCQITGGGSFTGFKAGMCHITAAVVVL